MNPTSAAILQTFEFLIAVGKAIIDIMQMVKNQRGAPPKTIDDVLYNIKGDIKVTFGLEPHLEGLIEELIDQHDEPRAYWLRAVRSRISNQEPKYETLVQMGLTPLALGAEALTKDHLNASPDEMDKIAESYMRRYILSESTEIFDLPALPHSTLSRAMEQLPAISRILIHQSESG